MLKITKKLTLSMINIVKNDQNWIINLTKAAQKGKKLKNNCRESLKLG